MFDVITPVFWSIATS